MAQQTFVVALTGPDGSGKSTLARALAERVPGSKIIDVWDTLRRSPLFTTKEAVQIHLQQLRGRARLLFIFHALEQSFAAAQEENLRLIIVDGHFAKYAATEIALGTDLDYVLGLLRLQATAHRTFFLSITPEEAARRKLSLSSYESGLSKDQSSGSFIEFQRRVVLAFETIEMATGPWQKLSAAAPLNLLCETIGQEIEPLMDASSMEPIEYRS